MPGPQGFSVLLSTTRALVIKYKDPRKLKPRLKNPRTHKSPADQTDRGQHYGIDFINLS